MKRKMGKFQSFWNLASNAAQPDILNMYVYGRITSSSHWLFGSETDVVTSQFVKDLRKFPDAKRINVYINSPGGDVFAAAAIKNQLKAHPAEVHSFIDGLGASAAVGLSMGADVVHMSRSALIMIHNPSTHIEGEVKDLEKGVEVLQKVKSTIVSIYKDKTGLSEDKLITLMNEESWLTADEALSLGFIDKIVEDDGLLIEDVQDGLIVNGVTFDFANSCSMKVGNYTFANNISKEKLEHKLALIKNKQGGNNEMNFEDILNSMDAEQRVVFDNAIRQQIADAIATEQKQWNIEKEELENQIKTFEDTSKAESAIPVVIDEGTPDILDTLPEEIRAIVVQARAETAEAQAKLALAESNKAMADFKQKLSVYDALPIQDAQITALYQLSIDDAVNFGHMENLLKVANAAMTAGFTTIGSDQGQDASNNAQEEINNKISILRAEHKDMNYNDALRCVATSDPDLYQRYRAELT